jgi:hypothetical protein
MCRAHARPQQIRQAPEKKDRRPPGRASTMLSEHLPISHGHGQGHSHGQGHGHGHGHVNNFEMFIYGGWKMVMHCYGVTNAQRLTEYITILTAVPF